MVANMRSMLQKINDTTSHLSLTGKELTQSSDATLASSHDLIIAIQAVKSSAEQTASSSEGKLWIINNMKDKISTDDWKHGEDIC